MCQKRNSRRAMINGKIKRIDACLANIIRELNTRGLTTLACCCGHGRYPMTIVVELKSGRYDLISSINLSLRKKRFYHKDEDGYYFITEVLKKEILK